MVARSLQSMRTQIVSSVHKQLQLTVTHHRWLIGLAMIAALLLHMWLAATLNIVEDESAYVQDAAQITWDVLPFREFGATKGPVFLILLKWWQLLAAPSMVVSRLLPSLAHVASIPLLYGLVSNLGGTRSTALLATFFWALTPVVVSLTSNVMHIPVELFFVLGALTLASRPRPHPHFTIPLVALLLYVAILTRATAIVFAPVFVWLIWLHYRSWRPLVLWSASLVGYGLVTIALIYPLYGWPKTAFFFNADATLIAQAQRQVYDRSAASSNSLHGLFQALLPIWRDGLVLGVSAFLFPFLALAQRRRLYPIAYIALLIGLSSLGQALTTDGYWAVAGFPEYISFLSVLSILTITGLVTALRPSGPATSTTLLWLVVIWIGSFIAFYRGWGRQPTPFYPLESLPALSIAAALAIQLITTSWRRLAPTWWPAIAWLLVMIGISNAVLSFWLIPQQQYRGTVELAAANAIAAELRTRVPADESVFTAQPVYAYLSSRPLYRYLTHPGWYLAERAGFMPPVIRRLFFPDPNVLAEQVASEVNWIVVDWRTADVYFNPAAEEMNALRELLATQFTPVVTVPNPASRDIVIYQRTSPVSPPQVPSR